MARRRQPDRAVPRDLPEVPMWIRNLGSAAVHFDDNDLKKLLPRQRAASTAWCAQNGCYERPLTCDDDPWTRGRNCDRDSEAAPAAGEDD